MARKEFRTEATVRALQRAGRSTNGNPTWDIVADEGIFRTQSDAQLGYVIDNFTNPRYETHMIGEKVTLVHTEAKRVWDIEKNGVSLQLPAHMRQEILAERQAVAQKAREIAEKAKAKQTRTQNRSMAR